MPHFGLMDSDALGPEAAALQRARLHIRGGKRRLRQGKVSAGLVTLYDALTFAMQWYVESPERRAALRAGPDDRLTDDRAIYGVLARSGVLDGTFDYAAFNELIEEALERELPVFDFSPLVDGIETIMNRLGVMPFDEGALPPEDPKTF